MTGRRFSLLAAALLACSSGGGGGTSIASGGVGGTGFSSGPIAGFGSFFVTGTEWSVAPGGTVLLDGVMASESDLELGMVVSVEGARSADGLTGSATRVVFDDEVEGPVSSLVGSPSEIQFVVFGQTFVADHATVFANTTFAQFQAGGGGALVELSGLPDVHPTLGSVIRATRLEWKAASATPGAEVELEGLVQNLVGSQFEIRSVRVRLHDPSPNCGPTDLTDVGGSLDDEQAQGIEVEVEGRYLARDSNGDIVCATKIEREDGVEDAEDFEIEGIVTERTSNTQFRVSDIPVNAAGASFEPVGLQVQVGMRVEVEGDLVGGVLVADEVKQRGGVEIQALVTESDVIQVSSGVFSGSFVVLGRSISVTPATEVDGGPITADRFVEVRAVDDGAGGLTATEVNSEPFDQADRVRVEGRVEAVDRSGRVLRITGIALPAVDTTQCRAANGSALDCADFFQQVQIGDEVQATDRSAPFDRFDGAQSLEFEE